MSLRLAAFEGVIVACFFFGDTCREERLEPLKVAFCLEASAFLFNGVSLVVIVSIAS